MHDNYVTLALQPKLNQQARNQALQAISQLGQALPCSVTAVNGSLVTVKFEVQSVPFTLPPLTLPKAESQWLRSPTQIGDVGLTVPADTFLGGVSGQGTGVANPSVNYGNLGTLVWVPIAATTFPSTPDANKAWVNGPHGARLGDSASDVYVDCDATSGTVTIKASGKTWTFGPAGFTMSSSIVAETHIHGGVQTGGGVTTGPEA